MCGIFGLARLSSSVKPSELALQISKLSHRGPDDQGTWVSDDHHAGLAHRRLSIIDLTAAGHQPMVDSSGRYAMVFNGEVYNYLELRNELETFGFRFRGSGDSEVVLASYIHWGEDCLSRFNGMFALAIYDSGSNKANPSIFLARDRAGKKPLYLAHKGESFVFASELKAIPSEFGSKINLEALNFYLALGYIPSHLCIVDGVSKLPPAHAARFEINSGTFRQWRWWYLPELNPDSETDVDGLIDEAESLMHDAVRLRLRSDVPVGVLLSGGLDSSLMVASAAHASTKVKTFTIGFPGSKLDETKYASIVARHFNTEHHVLSLQEPSLSVLNELAPMVDEPLADSSLIPAYLVSKLTVGHVKVAIGGDGGDELFGGYGDYTTAMSDEERLGWLPKFLIKNIALAAGKLPTGMRGRNRIYALRGGAYQSLIWGSPFFDAPARSRIFSQEALDMLGDKFMAPERFQFDLFMTGRDPVDSMTRTHFGSILPDDYLVKVDRASMAVGLEMRCPLLDYRLIEFAFGRLPSKWKVEGKEGRRLQKRIGKRLLPEQLNIDRKQGFSIPINDWFRNSNCADVRKIRGAFPSFIEQDNVDDLMLGHQNGRANGSRLFALFMLSCAVQNLNLES